MEIKKTLRDAMQESRADLIKALDENKENIEIDGSKYNENTIIRVSFDKRTDKALPSMMVLDQPAFLGEPTTEDIADLIKNRALNNQSITPNINQMMPDLSSGKTVINAEVMGAALKMENTINTYRKQVSNNPHIDWMMLDNYLVENIIDSLNDRGLDPLELRQVGYDVSDNLSQMKDQIISGAKEVMYSNTDSEGYSPIHKSKHIADNLLSESGSMKIIKDDEKNIHLYADMTEAIDDALERNGYERDYEFPSLAKFKQENPEVKPEQEPEAKIEDLAEMFGLSVEDFELQTEKEIKKDEPKKRNRNRPS